MTFGSLFSGIGGFDLGFERAGLRCAWQVEIDPFCQRVLAKHWPEVPRHGDIKTFPPEGDWSVDIICGGFPCQDISNAGKREGIDGERSGLWSDMLRVIRVVRPRYVVVENVAALASRGLDRVLGDLAASGFDAEWEVLPAAAFGAPHIRERVFILAYSKHGRECEWARTTRRQDGKRASVRERFRRDGESGRVDGPVPADSQVFAVAAGLRSDESGGERGPRSSDLRCDVPDAGCELLEVGGTRDGDRRRRTIIESCSGAGKGGTTLARFCRMVDGIP